MNLPVREEETSSGWAGSLVIGYSSLFWSPFSASDWLFLLWSRIPSVGRRNSQPEKENVNQNEEEQRVLLLSSQFKVMWYLWTNHRGSCSSEEEQPTRGRECRSKLDGTANHRGPAHWEDISSSLLECRSKEQDWGTDWNLRCAFKSLTSCLFKLFNVMLTHHW